MDQRKKVLLIEDDRYLSKIYSNKLRLNGFEVSVATTGEEGMHKAMTERPSLIFLDLILPGKDGFEVLEELRSQKTMAKTPIVILSNLGQQTDIQRGMSLGADAYLIKANLSLSQIVDVARQYIGGRGKSGKTATCPNCGKPVSPNDQFCPHCGKKLG